MTIAHKITISNGLVPVTREEFIKFHNDNETLTDNKFHTNYPKALKSVDPSTDDIIAIRVEYSYNKFIYGIKK